MSSRLRTNGPLQQAVQLCKHSLYLELLPELAAATPLLVRARAHEPDIFLSLERRRNRCDRIKGDLLSYHAIDRSILRSTDDRARFAYATTKFTSQRTNGNDDREGKGCGGGDPETANNAHDDGDGEYSAPLVH